MDSIIVSWSLPAVSLGSHAKTIIYRSTTNDPATATQVGIEAGSRFVDETVLAGVTYFYWIRMVSINGTTGNLIGPASATAPLFYDALNNELVGRIDLNNFSGDLKGEIARIDSIYNDLLDEVTNRQVSETTLSTAIGDLDTAYTGTYAEVTNKQTVLENSHAALAGEFSRIVAGTDETFATILTNSITQADVDSSIASYNTQLLAGGLDGKYATVDNLSQAITGLSEDGGAIHTVATDVTAVDTKVGEWDASVETMAQALNGTVARWDVKTNVNDLVGNVGFYNDGGTTKFAINAVEFEANTSVNSIGLESGLTNQGTNSFSLGNYSGRTDQGGYSVAVGYEAGYATQGNTSVAMGYQAGKTTQGNESIAIGSNAGLTNQGAQSTAIGFVAGLTNQAIYSIAVGAYAGETDQGNSSTAIGYMAGRTTQSTSCVAIGTEAGMDTQGKNSVCIGWRSGKNPVGWHVTAIGAGTVQNGCESNMVAIGYNAGWHDNANYGFDSVAIGYSAGRNIGEAAVAIGANAKGAGDLCTHIGAGAGRYSNLTHNTTLLLGYDAQSTASNQVVLGDANITDLRCNDPSISSLSDARDKTDIQDSPYGLDYIKDLRPVKFKWNYREDHYRKGKAPIKDGSYQIGFIAQELKQVQDAWGAGSLGSYHYYPEDVDEEGNQLNPDMYEADYLKLFPVLVKAVQEQQVMIEQLQQQVAALQ
jgi:hypothetical protein